MKYYTESLARIHLIFGLGSLLCILPLELMQFQLQYIKIMLMACNDSELSKDNEEPTGHINNVEIKLEVNQGGKNHEYDEDNDDESEDEDIDDYPFGTEPVSFYDSKFENIDHIAYFKRILLFITNN